MKKATNRKQKFDFSALKLEFYQSDYDEVKWFFVDNYQTYTARIRTNTAGWSEDKKLRKQQIMEKALAKEQEKRAKELEIPIDQLKSLKKSAILLYAKHLNKFIKDEKGTLKINVSDLDKIIKSIKVELWEPTTITKNENINKDEVIDEKDLIDD